MIRCNEPCAVRHRTARHLQMEQGAACLVIQVLQVRREGFAVLDLGELVSDLRPEEPQMRLAKPNERLEVARYGHLANGRVLEIRKVCRSLGHDNPIVRRGFKKLGHWRQPCSQLRLHRTRWLPHPSGASAPLCRSGSHRPTAGSPPPPARAPKRAASGSAPPSSTPRRPEDRAEVDGNRTRRTGIARPTRFEGGGAHQVLRHLPGEVSLLLRPPARLHRSSTGRPARWWRLPGSLGPSPNPRTSPPAGRTAPSPRPSPR